MDSMPLAEIVSLHLPAAGALVPPLIPLSFLVAAVLLPLTGSPRANRVLVGTAALIAACCLAVILCGFADSDGPGRFARFRFMLLRAWMPGGVLAAGVDSLAPPFLALILSSLPLCLSALRRVPGTRASACLACLCVSMAALSGAVLCLDLTLFCCLWAFIPCPLYLLLRLERPKAPDGFADGFVLFSLAAVVPLTAAVLAFFPEGGVRFLPALLEGRANAAALSPALPWLLLSAFAARTPLVPLHGWLVHCLRHAGPAGRILLLGPLPAVGVLVALRFRDALDPGPETCALFCACLAAAMLYSGCAALLARDSARLLTHLLCGNMALILLGLSLGTEEAGAGARLHALHLGLFLGALAFCLGKGPRRESDGDAGPGPRRSRRLGLLVLLASPLPGCGGFVGPALILTAANAPALILCAGTGILLLTLALGRLFIPRDAPADKPAGTRERRGEDLRIPEALALVPALLGLLGLGLGYRFLLDFPAAPSGLPVHPPHLPHLP